MISLWTLPAWMLFLVCSFWATNWNCRKASFLCRTDPIFMLRFITVVESWSISVKHPSCRSLFFWGGGAHTNSNTFFARCLPCLPDLPRCNFSCSPKTYSVWSLVVLTHQRWCSVITMVLTMKFESGYFIYSSQSHRTLWSYLMGNISLKSFYCNQKQIFRTSDCVTSIQ